MSSRHCDLCDEPVGTYDVRMTVAFGTTDKLTTMFMCGPCSKPVANILTIVTTGSAGHVLRVTWDMPTRLYAGCSCGWTGDNYDPQRVGGDAYNHAILDHHRHTGVVTS